MTIKESLLTIADAGLFLADNSSSNQEPRLLLIVLLDIEDTLDKGRPLAVGQDKQEINQKMDLLRTKIRTIIDNLPPEEAKDLMQDRGENLKHQFPVNG